MPFRRGRPSPSSLILTGLVLCVPSSARADWVASAYLGHAWTRSSTVALTLTDRQTRLEIAGVEYRAESFTSPPYYGYRIAWVPDTRRWLGLEVEVIHAKVFAEAARLVHVQGTLRGAAVDATLPLSFIVQRLAMSHGLNFMFANLALRREFGPVDSGGTRRYVAVVRAGAGPTIAHAESTVDHVNRDQYESGGVGAQAAGGLEVAVWRGLAAHGEYKFTWATPELEVAGGQATAPARSQHLVGGLAYRF
ncbi:MAG: hypothetical protein EXQ53_08235 [Acidobacteria bacterium]|nr:hypothetical protein [Acidobacteriota bacterium]